MLPGNRLLKRRYGERQLFKCIEKIEKADHFQGLYCELGRLQKADCPAALFAGRQIANKHTDSTGIDGGNFLEVENDFEVSLLDELGHDGIEAIQRRTHAEAPAQFDNLDAILSLGLDIHVKLPQANPRPENGLR